MKTVAKFVAFIAVVQGILILMAQFLTSILRLIMTFLTTALGDPSTTLITFFIICVLIFILTIFLWNHREKLKAQVSKRMSASRDKFGHMMKLKQKDSSNKQSNARRMLDKIDPELMRKMSYAAHVSGSRNISGALGKASVAADLAKTGLDSMDQRKLKRVDDNKDLIDGYRIGKDEKGNKQFYDKDGNLISKNDDKDLWKDLNKNKDLLMEEKDGVLFDPFTNVPVDDDSIYANYLSHDDHIRQLENMPDRYRKDDHEINKQLHEQRRIATEYVDTFNRFFNGDKSIPGSSLWDQDALMELYSSNPDVYDRLNAGIFNEEDIESAAGTRINGRKHIVIPETELGENGRVVTGLKTMEFLDGDLVGMRNSDTVAAALDQRDRYNESMAKAQAGLPQGVSTKFNSGEFNPEGEEDRDAKSQRESTRGSYLPVDADTENVEVSTREEYDAHKADMINSQAGEHHNPDTEDYSDDLNVHQNVVGGNQQTRNNVPLDVDENVAKPVQQDFIGDNQYSDNEQRTQESRFGTRSVYDNDGYEVTYSNNDIMRMISPESYMTGKDDDVMYVEDRQDSQNAMRHYAEQSLRRGGMSNRRDFDINDIANSLVYTDEFQKVLQEHAHRINSIMHSAPSGMRGTLVGQEEEHAVTNIKNIMYQQWIENAKESSATDATRHADAMDGLERIAKDIMRDIQQAEIIKDDQERTRDELNNRGEEIIMGNEQEEER